MNRETKIIGTYENINPGGPAMPKFDTPITPKENFLRFVSKDKKAVWTPNEIDIVSVLPKRPVWSTLDFCAPGGRLNGDPGETPGSGYHGVGEICQNARP